MDDELKGRVCPTSSSERTGQVAVWLLGLVGALVTVIIAGVFASRFQMGPVDDAFISLRYATNWARGHGLCYNPGEIVEGYSNFLLVLGEAFLIRWGLDPVKAMALLGYTTLGGLAGLMVVVAERHLYRGKPLLALTVGCLAGLNSVLLCWGLSGLEGCLFGLLLLGAITAVNVDGMAIGTIVSATLLVLAAMTRLEAVALFPVSLVAVFVRKRSWHQTTVHGSILALGFGSYFLVRTLHFGYMFPNTFYAKLDYGNWLLTKRGALYLWGFIRSNLPLFFLVGLALVFVRSTPRWVRLFLATAAVLLATVVYTGGDHFPMYRFMVPVIPFLFLVALYPAKRVMDRHRDRPFLSTLATILTLVALGSSSVMTAVQGSPGGPSQFAQFCFESRLTREWGRIGRWLSTNASPDDSLATIAIGSVGYFSKLRIVDPYGIINPLIAHMPCELGTRYPGHEKYDVDAVLAEHPSYILLINRLSVAPVPLAAVQQYAWGDFNQALSKSPYLKEQYRYQVLRLEHRFLNLFVRRDLPEISPHPTSS